LIRAIEKSRSVVLMATQAQVTHPTLAGAHPTLPAEKFLVAARTNWGVAWLDPDLDTIVRKHWPFPAPGPYPSLPWTAARLVGAQLSSEPREQWLRYYGRDGAWTKLSYRFAMEQSPGYFRNKIVFIGNWPSTSVADGEPDEFLTPYSRWTGESSGGVEIMITAFLNLWNHQWLERPATWIEASVVLVAGLLLGGTLCRLRPLPAIAAAVATAAVAALGGIALGFYTQHWFPWLVIAGGEVPVALIWAVLMPTFRRVQETVTEAGKISPRKGMVPAMAARVPLPPPDVSDYEIFDPPFGEGAYGKVWVARNAIGQWQALKVVYLANFGDNRDPYEREFKGISRFKPVSDKHPGLLRIDFVSKKRSDYFYYVMELGDGLVPGWERNPSTYRPHDLNSERARSSGNRLPVSQCIKIGLTLTDALEFLHGQGLTHRDIKPQNIIFVNGHPKLADVGLTAEIRPLDETRTLVGTPGYMPPTREQPGTPQADIYALGMVLYVLATGRSAALFTELSTTLVGGSEPADFMPLNAIILKACDPDTRRRYATAAEMHRDLKSAAEVVEKMARGV